MIHIIFSWVKNLGVKSAGVNKKRTNCAGISRTTEKFPGKNGRTKRNRWNRPARKRLF